MTTQTTLKLRLSIWYEVEGEHPEIRETAMTWHRLPDQTTVEQRTLELIKNFYETVAS